VKVKKGDTVLVIAGKDKGARGKVIAAYPRRDKVLVEGVNRVKKHTRIRTTNRGAKTGGGIVGVCVGAPSAGIAAPIMLAEAVVPTPAMAWRRDVTPAGEPVISATIVSSSGIAIEARVDCLKGPQRHLRQENTFVCPEFSGARPASQVSSQSGNRRPLHSFILSLDAHSVPLCPSLPRQGKRLDRGLRGPGYDPRQILGVT